MKKKMFNDKYDLTDAVLQGRKTMMRCLVGTRMTDDDIKAYLKGYTELANKCAPYKIGEVVAVAQSYRDVLKTGYDLIEKRNIRKSLEDALGVVTLEAAKGWNNKMCVRADLMPHQIKITDVNVERLRDISSKDILKEGFVKVKFDVYQGLSVVRTMSGYTLPQWKENIEDPWQSTIKDSFSAESPDVAISVLLYYLGGKDERFLNENPYVFASTFELVK